MSDKKDSQEPIAPVLEVPHDTESPSNSVGAALFSEDSFAPLMAKLVICESLLKLMTRDCNFNDFVRELLLISMRAVKSEAGSILEVDHNTKMLFFRSVVGQSSDRLSKFTIPMGQGISGHVAESKLPMMVDNVNENKRHMRSIQKAVEFEARNIVCLPIIVRGQIYGVIELLNRIGESNYSNQDMELLTYICDAAAKALEVRMMISWAKQQTKKEAA